MKLCYHFTGNTLRNGLPIPKIGKWLEHDGAIIPCVSGLHGSEHPFDALTYAPGPFLHLVELDGDLVSHGTPVDKWCGRRRKIIAAIDATALLQYSARQFALSVAHLWEAPDVVLEFLFTGDPKLRAAARDAAWAAGGCCVGCVGCCGGCCVPRKPKPLRVTCGRGI